MILSNNPSNTYILELIYKHWHAGAMLFNDKLEYSPESLNQKQLNPFLASILAKSSSLNSFENYLKDQVKNLSLNKDSLWLVWDEFNTPLYLKAFYKADKLSAVVVFGGFFENSDQLNNMRQSMQKHPDHLSAFESFASSIKQDSFLHKSLFVDLLNIFFADLSLSPSYGFKKDEFKNIESVLKKTEIFKDIYKVLDKIQDSFYPVLVQGDQTFIKNHLAYSIHKKSQRANKPFFSLGCKQAPETVEKMLFGSIHSPGIIHSANGGSVYLEDVSYLSPPLQSRLLKLIQSQTYTYSDSLKEEQANVRLVVSSKEPLQKLVDEKKFRQDLYYALSVIDIGIPPLRNFESDIETLSLYFLKSQDSDKSFSPEALKALKAYYWPGDVMELKSEIQKVLLESGNKKVITKEDLSTHIFESKGSLSQFSSLKEALNTLEKKIIEEGLEEFDWNRTRLSRRLGMSRANLLNKIEKYGLEEKSKKAK